MDFLALARKYQTPLYAYDLDEIKERFLEFRNAFGGKKSLICHALKANSNLSVIHALSSLESGADCVSIGEVKRAVLAGIQKYRIIFSGVGKSDAEITEALDLDVLFLNVESDAELARIEEIAKEKNLVARVSIRVNPDVDAKTHPYVSTGLSENKFGVDANTAGKMYSHASKSPFLQPVGIHFHIGSQLLDLDPIIEATEKIADFAKSLKALGIDLKFFDVGGGMGISYAGEKTINLKDYAQGILRAMKGLDMTVICEPGRYLTGKSGYFITKVLYEKRTKDKRFVIVDGGMNDLIRPALYGAIHRVKAHSSNPLKEEEASDADVVGPVCESADCFAKGVKLPPLNPGDLIVFEDAGAYGHCMSSNYNTRMRPPEVGIEGGKDRILRHREVFEDVIEDELKILQGENG